MTTYTLSAVSLPVTRGRPLLVRVGASPPSNPSIPPINLVGASLSAYISWGLETEPALVEPLTVGFRVSLTGQQTRNLPAGSLCYLVLTIVDTLGASHDIVFPLSINVVPNL